MNSLYIGLMSGTSLDAVDAVLVRFTPRFELLASHSTPLTQTLRQQILALTQPGADTLDALGALDVALGNCFAQAVTKLLEQSGTPAAAVAAIGSHGQTLRHRPEQGFTLQAGDPSRIAELTGITTVADFRRRDIAAGGQGAPLVPAFHQALFAKPGADRVLINVGGMANITSLPGDPACQTCGFDTGPGNILLDHWIQQQRQRPYDRDGDWAASGQVHSALLQQMLSDPYFQLPAPKSTGRERFNAAWLTEHLDRLGTPLAAEDVQATLLELTARSISDAIQGLTLCHPALYLCGGGAHNRQLLRRLQALQPDATVARSDVLGLEPDWVEAAAFAWLAWRTLNRESGNLPAVTGARGERILGAIYPA